MDTGEARLEPGFTLQGQPSVIPVKSQGSAGQGLKPGPANIQLIPQLVQGEGIWGITFSLLSCALPV